MKKRKFCISLAVLAVTLAMMVSSGFASNLPSVDGQYFQVMVAKNTGGTPPTEIVVGSNDCQFLPIVTANTAEQIQIPPVIAGTNSTSNFSFIAQDTSPMVGSGANIAQTADTASSGGSSFHAGKIFVASTPIAAGLMMTSIAT